MMGNVQDALSQNDLSAQPQERDCMTREDHSSRDLYEDLVARWRTDYRANGHTCLGVRAHRALYRHMLTSLIPQDLRSKPITFLDSACGNGYLAPLFRNHLTIKRLDGVDLNGQALSVASSCFGYTNVQRASVLDLDKTFHGTYDIVNNCDMFFHIDPKDRGRFWKAHCDKISRGGRMLCVVPNSESMYRLVRPLRLGFSFAINDIIGDIDALPGVEIESLAGVTLLCAKIVPFPRARRSSLKIFMSFAIGIVVKPL